MGDQDGQNPGPKSCRGGPSPQRVRGHTEGPTSTDAGRSQALADRGRTIDRPALRTTFVSWLGMYGVDPRAQIVLARHAPTGVTLRHYQDFTLFDLWAEIRKLPNLDGPVE